MIVSQKNIVPPTSRLNSSIWRLSASIIVASCLVGCTREVKNTPIPKGEVEINIQFTNISTAEFNVLNTTIKQLAGNHSKSLTDHNSFHGIGNARFLYTYSTLRARLTGSFAALRSRVRCDQLSAWCEPARTAFQPLALPNAALLQTQGHQLLRQNVVRLGRWGDGFNVALGPQQRALRIGLTVSC